MDFLAIYCDGGWGVDTDADVFPIAIHDHNADVAADNDLFA
jgi:hypothetical protein